MKKKIILTFAAVLTMFLAAGCKQEDENLGADVTKPPVEALTDAPSAETEGTTPLPGKTETDSAHNEDSSGLKFSFREETEEEKDGDFVFFKSTLYYPVFEGKNAEKMNGFLETVMETFRESLSEAKESARFDYEDSLSGEYIASIFPEKEEFTVSCLWESEQHMTLFTKGVSSTGGAHPNVYCRAYVVNLTNGCPESFERMLEEYGLTTEDIVAYATKKLRSEHGENLYDYDDAGEFKDSVYRLVQNNQWYFNDKGLVLFANPYELAAYAYGMIECEISYEELEQGLKK
ncbi:MAG: DUF3298 domain-containing protein [Lachnospiraceae bacterium]|nr:DUF3298 domain-containing protein [Lachnospiraceae bacterium]